MSGKVIETLRASPLLAALTEAEWMALANWGSVHVYEPGQMILRADGRDERVFILRQGRVALCLVVWTEGGRCGGEARMELSSPGVAFGWAKWIRPDRIAVSAYALEPVSLISLDLDRLKDPEVFWKISQHMLQDLYGRLQEHGLCPPNIRGLLMLEHVASI